MFPPPGRGAIRLDVHRCNRLIRQFGKARRMDGVFAVLDALRSTGTPRSAETYEFLAQAAVREVQFVTGAVSMATLPPDGAVPEAAFVGRSNVGKSSLLNMVAGRRALARTSRRPGKTQQFNYFLVNGGEAANRFYLVDLPGVGYAKVPKALQAEWLSFMRAYFRHRRSLRVVFHLIDGRHGPLADDQTLMGVMASGGCAAAYVVVLTKVDKLDGARVRRRVLSRVAAALAAAGCPPDVPVLETSAETRDGRDDMWRYLQLALVDPPRDDLPDAAAVPLTGAAGGRRGGGRRKEGKAIGVPSVGGR